MAKIHGACMLGPGSTYTVHDSPILELGYAILFWIVLQIRALHGPHQFGGFHRGILQILLSIFGVDGFWNVSVGMCSYIFAVIASWATYYWDS